jgi:hypothetical protein
MLSKRVSCLRRGTAALRSRPLRALGAVAIACALAASPAVAQREGGFRGGGFGGGDFRGGDFRGGGFAGGDFHGRDFATFGPGELGAWRGGLWRHEWHDGRLGWWWIVGGGWYFYPEPIWPYPTYVPPAFVVTQPPPVVAGVPPAQFWYFCDNPQGYYPNVQSCAVPWRSVPVTSPK